MLRDRIAAEVNTARVGVTVLRIVTPSQGLEFLEPARVDSRDVVVRKIQAVQVVQRVEDAPWQAGVGQPVVVQQQRVARRVDSRNAGEEVRRKRREVVVRQVQIEQLDALEQARRQRRERIATQVDVSGVGQVGEVVPIERRELRRRRERPVRAEIEAVGRSRVDQVRQEMGTDGDSVSAGGTPCRSPDIARARVSTRPDDAVPEVADDLVRNGQRVVGADVDVPVRPIEWQRAVVSVPLQHRQVRLVAEVPQVVAREGRRYHRVGAHTDARPDSACIHPVIVPGRERIVRSWRVVAGRGHHHAYGFRVGVDVGDVVVSKKRPGSR